MSPRHSASGRGGEWPRDYTRPVRTSGYEGRHRRPESLDEHTAAAMQRVLYAAGRVA